MDVSDMQVPDGYPTRSNTIKANVISEMTFQP